MQKIDIIRSLLDLIVNDEELVKNIIIENRDDLLIWFENQLKLIETEWDVTFKELFTHLRYDEQQQMQVYWALIIECSLGIVHLEDDYHVRQDMKSAREYFEKPLPESPIQIDIDEFSYIGEVISSYVS